MATHIPAQPNRAVEITPANGQFWTLKELQTLVGGPIEAVYLNGGVRDGQTMYVHEEGLFAGLSVNHIASAIAIDEGNFPQNTRIVGDVVVVPYGETPEAHDQEGAD